MAYIGNTVENQGFTPAIDYFNGNGVTVTFTLSRPIASVAQVIVAIDNVIQNPNSSFTVAGNAITFSSAPLSGTNNIWVEYTSLITTYQAISQDPTVIGDIRATGGYLAEGDFGNSFVDGVIVDYVTGLGRVTVGTAEGIALYNGGTASRTERMRIDSSGNVGIGVSAPTRLLHIDGGASATYFQMTNTASGRTNADGFQIAQDGTAVELINRENGYMGFNTSNTERMRIDSSGRVLIGATATVGSAKFLVAGVNSSTSPVIQAGSNAGAYLTCYNNAQTTGGFQIGQGFASGTDNVAVLLNNDNAALVLGTNGAERMRIDSSGNLLISETTRWRGTGRISMTTGGEDGISILTSAAGLIVRKTSYGNSFIGLWENNGGSTVGSITTDGSTTSYNTSSDYRLKENIAPMTGALSTVALLKPVTYTWKESNTLGQGFIAHELQAVVPDCVHGEKDAVDKDGKIIPQGIDTSFLVATLTAAIQEQQAMIEELKTKVAALEAK